MFTSLKEVLMSKRKLSVLVPFILMLAGGLNRLQYGIDCEGIDCWSCSCGGD